MYTVSFSLFTQCHRFLLFFHQSEVMPVMFLPAGAVCSALLRELECCHPTGKHC